MHDRKNFFDIAAHTYDEYSTIQKYSAEFLSRKIFEFCNGTEVESLLDIGSGTGAAALAMKKYFPKLNISLSDLSKNMLNLAYEQMKNPNVKLIHADFDIHEYELHDVTIANFSLQWSKNFFSTIERIFKKTKIFGYSVITSGTFLEIDEKLKILGIESSFDNYLSHYQLLEGISKIAFKNFRAYSKSYKLNFTKLESFFDYVKYIGAVDRKFSLSVADKRKLVTYFRKNIDENIEVNYKVFYVVMGR